MSFHEQTEKLVNELIHVEYENACENWGDKYHSLHEGYAVLTEKRDEARDEYSCFMSNYEYLWEEIKDNAKGNIKTLSKRMFDTVFCQIWKLAQVGAVLMKIRNTLEEDRSGNSSK